MFITNFQKDRSVRPRITESLAVGLFRAVGVVMISQHLMDLIHQLELWIGTKLWLVFHFVP